MIDGNFGARAGAVGLVPVMMAAVALGFVFGSGFVLLLLGYV